ncbi:MAG: hypothetical protein MUO76_12055 [Anaerolineaceae bacterium]|nr:hypothetical protein [Anaerolineaceae bacterium]
MRSARSFPVYVRERGLFRVIAILGFMVFGLIILPACGSLPALARATATLTKNPTGSTQESTATERATMMVIASSTALPAEALESTPTHLPLGSQLAEDGAWVLISTDDGLWAINQDGSGLTQLTNLAVEMDDLSDAVSSQGGYVAFVTWEEDYSNKTLQVLRLPTGEIIASIPLTTEETQQGLGIQSGNDFSLLEAIGEFAWSPDGDMLAFNGLLEGTTSDVYVYSVAEQMVTRLTDEPTEAIKLHWSPDGKYIIHYSVHNFGAGAGYNMDGAWAAKADDSGVVYLYDPRDGDQTFHGWLTPTTFVVSSWDAKCGDHSIMSYDIETGVKRTILDTCFMGAALETDGSHIMVTIMDTNVDFCDCKNVEYQAGVHLISMDRISPTWIYAENAYNPQWLDNVDMFIVTASDVIGFRLNGERINFPFEVADLYPVISSPEGPWAYASTGPDTPAGLWIDTLHEPPDKVFGDPVQSIIWVPDGSSLFFTSNGDFYMAHAPDYEPVFIADLSARDAAWVDLDESKGD